MSDVHTDVPTHAIQSVSFTQLASDFNLTERQMKERLRAFEIPIVKIGRKKRVFVADVARLINLATRAVAAGPPASSKRNQT